MTGYLTIKCRPCKGKGRLGFWRSRCPDCLGKGWWSRCIAPTQYGIIPGFVAITDSTTDVDLWSIVEAE